MRYVFGDYCLDTQRYELHNALMPLDEQARILDHLHAAEALAERLDDPQRLRSIAGRLCFYFVAMGEYNRALAAGQCALALATTSGAVDSEGTIENQMVLVRL
jgi:hypothetical protein